MLFFHQALFNLYVLALLPKLLDLPLMVNILLEALFELILVVLETAITW